MVKEDSKGRMAKDTYGRRSFGERRIRPLGDKKGASLDSLDKAGKVVKLWYL